MKSIHLGTIGTGDIVHRVLDNAVKTESVKLCAVYSRTQEKADELANRYGAEKTYTDIQAFLYCASLP